MRTAFIDTLTAAAADDPRIWLVTGDIGYSVVERFAERFPDRFLNAGVAEQNMTGVAAGLALCGAVAVTYSIANFPTLRCLEQLRNDVCAHNLNVKVVAVGGGLTYAAAGYSHQAVEDFAFLAALPNMTVIAPGDPVETRLAVRAMLAHPGPVYLRLGKTGEANVHKTDPQFRIGRMIRVRDGDDAAIIGTGGLLESCVDASEALAKFGVRAGVWSCHTLAPLDEAGIVEAARATGCVVTVEEHGPGGLGTLAGEALARAGVSVRFRTLRLPRTVIPTAGSQDALRAVQGLSVDGIAAAVREACR